MSRIGIALAAGLITFAASPALAKGCLKGAAVGAVGGHFIGKGHAKAGAAAGCVVGHHQARKAIKKH